MFNEEVFSLLLKFAPSASADKLHIATTNNSSWSRWNHLMPCWIRLQPVHSYEQRLSALLSFLVLSNSFRAVTMILIAPTWTGKNVRLLVNRRLDVKEGVGRVAGTDGLVRRHRMSTTALNCERLLTAVVSQGASHHRPSPALALARTPPSLPHLTHQREHISMRLWYTAFCNILWRIIACESQFTHLKKILSINLLFNYITWSL